MLPGSKPNKIDPKKTLSCVHQDNAPDVLKIQDEAMNSIPNLHCLLQMDPLTLGEIALSYGFVPIPLAGKRPLNSRWEQTQPDKALEIIKDWRNRGKADNVGILTGAPSGIVVVDIDTTKGGLDYWQQLLQKHPLPETFTVLTGSGGYHYYFRYTGEIANFRNANEAIRGKGIDLKTTGGQVVFAGSTHPETGRRYLVAGGYPETGPIIADPPTWLINVLRPAQL